VSDDHIQFDFGLNRNMPYGAYVAWGARAIFDPHGIDILPDRQSVEVAHIIPEIVEEVKRELIDYLNENFNRGQMDDAVKRLVPMDVSSGPDEAPIITLFEDDRIKVEASTNRSFGYLYLRAYFHTDKEGQRIKHYSPAEIEEMEEWERDHDYARRIEL